MSYWMCIVIFFLLKIDRGIPAPRGVNVNYLISQLKWLTPRWHWRTHFHRLAYTANSLRKTINGRHYTLSIMERWQCNWHDKNAQDCNAFMDTIALLWYHYNLTLLWQLRPCNRSSFHLNLLCAHPNRKLDILTTYVLLSYKETDN